MIKRILRIFKPKQQEKPKAPVDILVDHRDFLKEVTVKHIATDDDNVLLELTHKPTAFSIRFPGEIFTLLNDNEKNWRLYELWKQVNNV